MRSFNTDTTAFHYNSDFSGDMIIVNKDTNEQIEIPASDIKLLTSSLIKDVIIAKIENSDVDGILSLLFL